MYNLLTTQQSSEQPVPSTQICRSCFLITYITQKMNSKSGSLFIPCSLTIFSSREVFKYTISNIADPQAPQPFHHTPT